MNVCSYHLQEAGATPVQELAFSLATAVDVLDAVRSSSQVDADGFAGVFASISFFVNAGIRFVEEVCKLRAFSELWERIGRTRYGVDDAKALRFRYGVQVNSLGLTEAQPENNVARIVLEMLGVTLSKRARARSVQLPAWNEALGLPRPWDQQWSLRMQQVLAFESDLLEYDDVFDGSVVVERRTAELVDAAWAELEAVIAGGGAFAQIDALKARLVASMAERTRRIEQGDQVVVGVNRFSETEPSPLGGEGSILRVDPAVAAAAIADVEVWRAGRDEATVTVAIDQLRRAAAGDENVMPATLALARAGGTTGEWGAAIRDTFGEYRGPTGVGAAGGRQRAALRAVADRVRALPGGPPRLLVAKPGLDGHSNGAEQIAVAAHDAGLEVVYAGIRSTIEQIAAAAHDEDPDVVGLSMLSGSHLELVPDLVNRLHAAGARHAGDRRRHHPGGGSPPTGGRGGRRGVHAEGLRHLTDHGRDRRPRRSGARRAASVIAAAAAAAAFLAVASSSVPPPVTPTGYDLGRIELTDTGGAVRSLPVWIADTDAELQRGLMGVTNFGSADGMLFVFDTTADWRFYMWQTLIPLSIAWFAEDGTFVGAAEMVPCTSDDESGCDRYSPGTPYRFAVELPSGGAGQLALAAGDRMTVLGPSWWQAAVLAGD